MTEFLKTLLFLNIQGSVLIVVLLLLKGIIRKSFSGLWQRNLWLIAFVFMLLPVWKLVPVQTVEPIFITFDDVLTTEYEMLSENGWSDEKGKIEETETDKNFSPAKKRINPLEILSIVYILGVIVFLLLNFGSYFIYLFKMKRQSTEISGNEVFEEVKEKLRIRRKIRVRKVNISQPPLLVGCFFPVVYLPEGEIKSDDERMVFLHELTHYKHRDLPIKWLASIINAVNWFNPLLYFAMKSLNEGCEIYCDESVTKGMDEEGKRAYMNIILNLVGKK